MFWIAPYDPGTNEAEQYERRDFHIEFAVNTFTWMYRLGQGAPAPAGPLQLVFEDGTVSAPHAGIPQSGSRYYPFQITIANGHHIPVACNGLNPATTLLRQKEFLVNSTAAALPAVLQTPWTSTTRHDYEGIQKLDRLQVPWPGALPVPVTYPLKARASPRITVIRPDWLKDLWYSRIHTSVRDLQMHHWRQTRKGDYVIGGFQKYEWLTFVSTGSLKLGLDVPAYPVIDGVRGVSTTGGVNQIIPRVGGTAGYYFGETCGSFRFMGTDGTIKTLWGWRIKPGVIPSPEGIQNGFYVGPPTDLAALKAKWEFIGDYSKMPASWQAIGKMHEPWGLAVYMRDPVLGLVIDDGHEGLFCDTLNHCVPFWNHWTAHPADHYEAAHYPPEGYVSPSAPIGQTQIAPFAGTPGTITATCNEPMCVRVSVLEEAAYWTNFAGNSICEQDLTVRGEEVTFKCAINPTDAQLGLGLGRMHPSQTPLATLRANFVRDGPQGVGTCVRPVGMDFKSGWRKIVFAEEVTYMLRELNLDTMSVRTLCPLPNITIGDGSSYSHTPWVEVDREGVFGAVDDIFVVSWNAGNFRFTKDGVLRVNVNGSALWGTGHMPRIGRGDQADSANYTFGLGISRRPNIARLVTAGNAAGEVWNVIDAMQPTDVPCDEAQQQRGWTAYNACSMFLKHGVYAQGKLGFKTLEQFGADSDAVNRAYALSQGMAATGVDDWIAVIKHETQGFDYVVAPPILPPDAPTAPLAIISIN